MKAEDSLPCVAENPFRKTAWKTKNETEEQYYNLT
jgi:hypothetical protein